MYDEIIKIVKLTSDEVDILSDVLSHRLEQCISVGEEIIVKELLHKIN